MLLIYLAEVCALDFVFHNLKTRFEQNVPKVSDVAWLSLTAVNIDSVSIWKVGRPDKRSV